MNKDQRLIPFIGGLAIGGLGGAAFNRYNYGGYYYPYNYAYTYPYSYPYSNYQYPYYYQQRPQQYIANQMNNPYYNNTNSSKIMGDIPTPITYSQNERSYVDLSYVPPYNRY